MNKRRISSALFAAMLLAVAALNTSCEPPVDPNTPTENPGAAIPQDMTLAFPDSIFRQYVLDNFDTDKDGLISESEAAAVTRIEFSAKYSASLKGVEYFTNLTYLSCPNNKLTNLDLSKNTELTYLHCSSNQLTSLDVSGCTKLTYLECRSNQLTSLDVTNSTKLISLYCNYNQLTRLDVSKNTEMITLDCRNNGLTSLGVSKNTKLKTLNCYNNQLTSLDVSKNMELTNLTCSSNQLTKLDVSKNRELIYLHCSSNQLTELDLSKTNLVNSKYNSDDQSGAYPFWCSPMPTLKKVYLKHGWTINGVNWNRNSYCIPDETEIVFID